MNETQQTKLDREAAEWFVRLSDSARPSGVREQSRWIGWLQRSPKHVEAYMALDDLCERLAESGAVKDFDVEGWLAGQKAPVVRIADVDRSRDRPLPNPPPLAGEGIKRMWGLAASIAAVGIAVGVSWWILRDESTYRTGLGEQNTFRLADGSVLQLNTQSRARVMFSSNERSVQLEGEGLFTVAPDAARPFRVRTKTATAQALGTRFNVYEYQGATKVSVLEGAVRVSSAAPGKSIDLTPGQEARITANAPARAPAPDVARSVAWQSRTLVFERTQLADVAAEFNRYNRMQFRIDPSAGTENRLSGTFDARHPQSLLLWLQSRPDLKVIQQGDVYLVKPLAP